MANVTYTVVWGDTLSAIARKYNTTVSVLAKLNNISNPNYIVVGQVLIVSGAASAKKANTSNKATIKAFGLQTRTDRTVYATWSWDKTNTEEYKVKWVYATGDGVGFIGSETTVTAKQALYTAPENATHVAFYVKPISKKRTVNGKETSYWTADWSTVQKYYFSKNPPAEPSVPTVDMDGYTLTAELNNIDLNATGIEFEVVKNDKSKFKTGKAKISKTTASYSCTVTAGGNYKVRARAYRGELYSEWSDYSENVTSAPSAPDGIKTIKALSSTSVYLAWATSGGADEYEIQYTTQKRYFDSSNEVQTMTLESVVRHAEITGLESGQEWFFRVRGISKGDAEVDGEDGGGGGEEKSPWTDIASIKLGEAPSVPTTWASTTTVIVGERLNLYWVHNSEDGSAETYAMLELDMGGKVTTKILQNPNADDEDTENQTRSYSIDTNDYTEGVKIKWRVKTKGIVDTYSDWSIQRTVDVYAPPTLSISLTDVNNAETDTLESFPFYLSGTVGPNTQTAIGYHVSIKSTEAYETIDDLGNAQFINAGDEVFSRYFDASVIPSLAFSANDVNLENNVKYTIIGVVSMNSGLTATDSRDFSVAWGDSEYTPDAEIGYDDATFTTYVRPYCADENGDLIEGVTLSVYRREFDGQFTELATGLVNTEATFITDPHPALDYARYRVVAVTDATGAVSYYDVPGYPVGEKAVIIQWEEDWSNFDTNNEDPLEQPVWSGSLLRLPYNIDVSDNYSADVALVEYIGRKRPVTYYGTQLGETSSWRVSIPKEDVETLYALRRLAIWMGDVYVREPSGSGYWANLSVSFSQTHNDPVIPVSLEITRVSGGA